MRKILLIIMLVWIYPHAASAQDQVSGIELFDSLRTEFDLGKYSGRHVISEGQELRTEHVEELESRIIPAIYARVGSGECKMILIEGVFDKNLFQQFAKRVGAQAVPQQELGDARAAAVKYYLEKNTSLNSVRFPVSYAYGTTRTVRFYCIAPDFPLERLEELIESRLKTLEDRIRALETRPENTDLLLMLLDAVREEGKMNRDHTTAEHEVTREKIGTLAHPTLEFGYRVSSVFNDGVSGAFGVHFPRWGFHPYLEAYVELGSHNEALLYRPYRDIPVDHWGTYGNVNLMFQFHTTEIGNKHAGVYLFFEVGAGAIVVDYDEPSGKSIGFYDNGWMFPIRGGVVGRAYKISLKLTAGQETYIFPWSPVYDDFAADSELHVSGMISGKLGFHFGGHKK